MPSERDKSPHEGEQRDPSIGAPTTNDEPSAPDAADEPSHEQQGQENPPLPPDPPPEASTGEDDGWQPVWDSNYGAYYFYNSVTGETTWTNPRVPEAANAPVPPSNDLSSTDDPASHEHNPLQYNPALHGDYDPTAPYAQAQEAAENEGDQYTFTAAFNRFTGKFQPASSLKVPENYNDENKSKRQMQFYFDVDAAANSHDGKSLKAERQTRRLTKKELKEFKEKRRQRKEEKRKAWLKD